MSIVFKKKSYFFNNYYYKKTKNPFAVCGLQKDFHDFRKVEKRNEPNPLPTRRKRVEKEGLI